MSSAASTPRQQNRELPALYALNKAAKQFEQTAQHQTDMIHRAVTESPEVLRTKKRALYKVKQRVLEQLYTQTTHIEKHEIRSNEYYCFYFGSWSFHLPVEEFSKDVRVDGRLVLPDFDSSNENVRTQLSLGDALKRLKTATGIDANDYLDKRHFVATDGEFVDIGWPALDDVQPPESVVGGS